MLEYKVSHSRNLHTSDSHTLVLPVRVSSSACVFKSKLSHQRVDIPDQEPH